MRRAFVVQRHRLPSAPSARRRWRTLLDAARSLQAMASGSANGRAPAAALADFNHLCLGVRANEFPVGGSSPQWVADAFLRLGRAVFEAGDPQWREAYTPALVATAEALETLMDLQRNAEAEAGRRVMGEVD